MEQRTVTIKNFSQITKIVQVSAMKVHFQIAEAQPILSKS